MSAKEEYCFVYVTTKDEAEARTIGKHLVETKLVACVNVLPQMHSIYRWEGKVESATESVLIAKTLSQRYTQVEKAIVEKHSYTTPCVLRLAVEGGSAPYLNWISESVLG